MKLMYLIGLCFLLDLFVKYFAFLAIIAEYDFGCG